MLIKAFHLKKPQSSLSLLRLEFADVSVTSIFPGMASSLGCYWPPAGFSPTITVTNSE